MEREMTISQNSVGGPLDLIAVYENLVTMIRARCRGLDEGSNPWTCPVFVDGWLAKFPLSLWSVASSRS